MGNSKINHNFFSKKRIACSVLFPHVGMFEVYKNRNILQFAQCLYLSRILKMMVQMHIACYTGGIFLYDIRSHTYD